MLIIRSPKHLEIKYIPILCFNNCTSTLPMQKMFFCNSNSNEILCLVLSWGVVISAIFLKKSVEILKNYPICWQWQQDFRQWTEEPVTPTNVLLKSHKSLSRIFFHSGIFQNSLCIFTENRKLGPEKKVLRIWLVPRLQFILPDYLALKSS